MTAVQVQLEFLEQARKYVEDRFGPDVDDITADVLLRWESVLGRLSDDPMQLSDELDWVAKLSLLEGYRQRESLSWGAHKLQLVDLQYHDVRQERGLYNRLVARGSMKTLFSSDVVERAMSHPPEDTRAYFRGRCLAKFGSEIVAASWDSVIFDLPGRESLQRIPMLEPLRGTRAHVGALIDRCDTASELVAALTGQ
jgi:proteasome accessory factor A